MQQALLPVDVICLSGADGEIRPLRIRAETETEETWVGNVSEILAVRKHCLMGAEIYCYLCRIRSENCMTVLELRFFKRSHSWYISGRGGDFSHCDQGASAI